MSRISRQDYYLSSGQWIQIWSSAIFTLADQTMSPEKHACSNQDTTTWSQSCRTAAKFIMTSIDQNIHLLTNKLLMSLRRNIINRYSTTYISISTVIIAVLTHQSFDSTQQCLQYQENLCISLLYSSPCWRQVVSNRTCDLYISRSTNPYTNNFNSWTWLLMGS